MRYNILVLFVMTFFVTGCEEGGFEFRKVELTINGKMEKQGSFSTSQVDFAVLWDKSDVLALFDISEDAEILNFWVKDIKAQYHPCDVIEAEKLDLEIYASEPQGAITLAAFLAGIDLKNISKTVNPNEPIDLDLQKQKGGVTALNGLLQYLFENEDSAVNVIVEGQHHPANALACGSINIILDVYIVYKECRLIPYGSEAGEECGE